MRLSIQEILQESERNGTAALELILSLQLRTGTAACFLFHILTAAIILL